MYWHFISYFLNENQFKVEQIKANHKFHGEKKIWFRRFRNRENIR